MKKIFLTIAFVFILFVIPTTTQACGDTESPVIIGGTTICVPLTSTTGPCPAGSHHSPIGGDNGCYTDTPAGSTPPVACPPGSQDPKCVGGGGSINTPGFCGESNAAIACTPPSGGWTFAPPQICDTTLKSKETYPGSNVTFDGLLICQTANPNVFASQATANALADCLDATAKPTDAFGVGVAPYGSTFVSGPYQISGPLWAIQFPNGGTANAGLLAASFATDPKGDYTKNLIKNEYCSGSSFTGKFGGNGPSGGSGSGYVSPTVTVPASFSSNKTIQTSTDFINTFLAQLNLLSTGGLMKPGIGVDGKVTAVPAGVDTSLIASITDLIKKTFAVQLSNVSISNSYKFTGTGVTPGSGTGTGGIDPGLNQTCQKTVNVDVLNVRIAPSLTSLVLSQFKKGDTFGTVGSVTGENVEGNNIWWKIGENNYVWSGGTANVAGSLCPGSSTGTGSNPPAKSVPLIGSINPVSGVSGITATLVGNGFTEFNNSITFSNLTLGTKVQLYLSAEQNNTVLHFVIPFAKNPSTCTSSCTPADLNMPAGVYQVTVSNANGVSNSATFTVTP